jgi:tetratricopeptide repeat protein
VRCPTFVPVVFLLLAPPAMAEAQDARALFREGMSLYQAGNYRGALDRFEQGYAIEHEPAFLYNIGRCHEQLGEIHPAIDAYEQYLTVNPDGRDAQDVQGRITHLQEQADRESAEASPPPTAATPAEPSGTEGEEAPPGPRGKHQLGGGLAVVSPRQNPLTLRFEVEYRFQIAAGWRLTGDVSYIQIGESGDSLSEHGFGAWAGILREWTLGDPARASWYPHARLGLAFERTTTRHATSSILVAARGGPGIDWRVVPHGSLSLDLEVGMGMLSISAGSGDAAKFELTLGVVLRLLFDFG